MTVELVVWEFNRMVVPVSRCKMVRKILPGTRKKIEASFDLGLGVADWLEAFCISWPLRGLMDQGRISLGRYMDKTKGTLIIERILGGEYDSWLKPTYPDSMPHPDLDGILECGETPLDWLRVPSGMVDFATIDTSFRYVVRMLNDRPHLRNWLLRTHLKDSIETIRNGAIFKPMRGLLDCLLLEDEFLEREL